MGRVAEKYISKKQVEQITGLSRSMIDAAMKKGMPYYKLGDNNSRVLFRISEVQQWLRERRMSA